MRHYRKYQQTSQGGFTLTEVMIALGLTGLAVAAVLSCINNSLDTISLDREQARATQIVVEKIEELRGIPWSQLQAMSGGLQVADALNPESATGDVAGQPGSSQPFNVTIDLTAPPVGQDFQTNLVEATVTVQWQHRSLTRSRSGSTFISKTGLFNR